ncbi:MAG: glycosyltransferase [Deltaproteobacteria bacterium]|nr:glycosyltransferase [Deltaproteobacteria bacterium]
MRICMFTNTYLPHVGGVANSVAAFAEDLRYHGHGVLIVAPVYEREGEKPDGETDVLRLPAIQNFNGSDFSLRLPVPFVIEGKLDKFRPQIIHSHHPYLLGDTALRTARRRRLPLVFTHHTLYENYTHYVPLESKGMRRFVVRLSTEYANLCTRVIAPSKSILDLLVKRGVTRPIVEIPTGVDTNFFSAGQRERARRKLGLSEGNIVLGHLGRLAPEKNLEYLAAAAADYVKKDEHAWFLAVGSGPSEDEIKRAFARRSIRKRLIMAGQKAGSELADLYAAMDLFLFASRTETQGMVLTEAMASGKPVIALDASGVREVVRDRYNGRLLDAEAPVDDFSAAIAETIRDKDLMKRYGLAARKTANEFSREVCSKKLEDLYQSLEAEHARSRRREATDHQALTSIVERLKVEWELAVGMTSAVVEAFASDDEDIGVE